MAGKYFSWSPYVYALDNPIRYLDIDGMAVGDPLKKMQLRGHYSSTWGTDQSKFGKVRGTAYHQGWDLYAPLGTSINSVGTGTVVKTETDAVGFGQQVIVKYSTLKKKDGTEIKDVYVRYAHLSEINVKKDDPVTEASVIGKTGKTGNAKDLDDKELHLHIEYMKSEDPGTGESGNDNRYDPKDFLTADDAVESQQTGKENDWTTESATSTSEATLESTKNKIKSFGDKEKKNQ